jgi:hypothetical protein
MYQDVIFLISSWGSWRRILIISGPLHTFGKDRHNPRIPRYSGQRATIHNIYQLRLASLLISSSGPWRRISIIFGHLHARYDLRMPPYSVHRPRSYNIFHVWLDHFLNSSSGPKTDFDHVRTVTCSMMTGTTYDPRITPYSS